MLVLLSTGKSKELKRKIAESSTVSNFLDKVFEKSTECTLARGEMLY